jgi:transposase
VKKRERFSNSKIFELEKMRKSSKCPTEVKRAQAILMLNSNADGTLIKSVTDFDKRSASRLRRKYLDKGLAGIITKKRKPRALLKKSELKIVEETIKTKIPKDIGINADFWTTSILAEYIEKDFNVAYKSKTSYCLVFKQYEFTYRKPDKVYHKRSQESIDQWIEEKTSEIKQYLNDPESVILVGDEMILTTKTTAQKIWLQKGAFSKIEISNKGGKRCIYGFLNVKNWREHAFKTDYTNSLTTCSMLKELIKLYPDKKITLIWDSASWHRSKTVRAFLEANPNKFHLIAFPTYSPELNPQEHVWKAGRSAITHNRFIEDIDRASDEFVDYLNNKKFEYKFL